jgi:hypothetical protein
MPPLPKHRVHLDTAALELVTLGAAHAEIEDALRDIPRVIRELHRGAPIRPEVHTAHVAILRLVDRALTSKRVASDAAEAIRAACLEIGALPLGISQRAVQRLARQRAGQGTSA